MRSLWCIEVGQNLETTHRMCVVCLDKPADTIALPCEHVVVCHDCSHQLAHSKFSDNCVYCRQHIDIVLEDEKQ
jgi:hypothetical protein